MLQHLHSGLGINTQYTSDGRSCFFETRLLDLDFPKKYSKSLITWQYLWYWLFSTYWDQAFISTTFSPLPDRTLFVLEQYVRCPYWWKCAAWPVKPIWWKWWQLSAWGGTRCGFGRPGAEPPENPQFLQSLEDLVRFGGRKRREELLLGWIQRFWFICSVSIETISKDSCKQLAANFSSKTHENKVDSQRQKFFYIVGQLLLWEEKAKFQSTQFDLKRHS